MNVSRHCLSWGVGHDDDYGGDAVTYVRVNPQMFA